MKKKTTFHLTAALLTIFLAGQVARGENPVTAGQPAAARSAKTFTQVDEAESSVEVPRNFVVVPGKDPNGWSFTLEPYLWAMGMSGDIAVKGLPAVHVDYSAKTIIEHLDWGLMAKGEIRKGRWGILGDGFFAQLSADGSPAGPLYDSASVKVQQGMTSLAIAFRVIDDHRWFLDVYAGARYNYLGINVDTSVDSSGIQTISENATERIVSGIGQSAEAILAANAAAPQSEIVGTLGKMLTGKDLENIAAFPSDVRNSLGDQGLLDALDRLQTASGSYQELLAAVAEAKIAAAKGQLTSAIQNRLSKAQNKFSRELANTIEDALPTSAEGSNWWIDPIIGLRAQANITRWLFLAVQGDVGGFGAGSEIAWNVSGSLGVNITRNIFAEVGYRYFYMDYSNGGALYNAAEAGIFSGIGVKF